MHKCVSYRLLFAVLFIGCATIGWAQTSSSGAVSGLVTDQQNAAIPGVEVLLTNPATNTALKATTNDAGRYIFPTVPPSTYNVTFTKQGFSVHRLEQQPVGVGQLVTLDAKLEVGSLTTIVDVSAAAAAELQTVNATVGTTVSGASLISLPVFGSDASSLAL